MQFAKHRPGRVAAAVVYEVDKAFVGKYVFLEQPVHQGEQPGSGLPQDLLFVETRDDDAEAREL